MGVTTKADSVEDSNNMAISIPDATFYLDRLPSNATGQFGIGIGINGRF